MTSQSQSTGENLPSFDAEDIGIPIAFFPLEDDRFMLNSYIDIGVESIGDGKKGKKIKQHNTTNIVPAGSIQSITTNITDDSDVSGSPQMQASGTIIKRKRKKKGDVENFDDITLHLMNRREKNKEHAKKSRIKKKNQFTSLELSMQDLQTENVNLKNIIRYYIPENAEKLIASASVIQNHIQNHDE